MGFGFLPSCPCEDILLLSCITSFYNECLWVFELDTLKNMLAF